MQVYSDKNIDTVQNRFSIQYKSRTPVESQSLLIKRMRRIETQHDVINFK